MVIGHGMIETSDITWSEYWSGENGDIYSHSHVVLVCLCRVCPLAPRTDSFIRWFWNIYIQGCLFRQFKPMCYGYLKIITYNTCMLFSWLYLSHVWKTARLIAASHWCQLNNICGFLNAYKNWALSLFCLLSHLNVESLKVRWTDFVLTALIRVSHTASSKGWLLCDLRQNYGINIYWPLLLFLINYRNRESVSFARYKITERIKPTISEE